MRTHAPARRPFWSRLLSTTALATASALAVTTGQLPALNRQAPAADSAPYDLAAAAQVREDQCRLGNVLRKGGPAMKEVARAGLSGTDAQLRAAANEEYRTDTPLAVAFGQDRTAALAKLD